MSESCAVVAVSLLFFHPFTHFLFLNVSLRWLHTVETVGRQYAFIKFGKLAHISHDLISPVLHDCASHVNPHLYFLDQTA